MAYQSESQKFLDDLPTQLTSMSRWQQMAFGALCCNRHLPSYVHFSELQGWGDPQSLQIAIDMVWTTIATHKIGSDETLFALLKACEAAIPDSDTFFTAEADYAQDTAIMVITMIKFVGTARLDFLLHCAELARDLIDAKVQMDDDLDMAMRDFERRIDSSILMTTEISKQRATLSAAQACVTSVELIALRHRLEFA
jgi:uncharacterized protein YjaG (DUF416 family)